MRHRHLCIVFWPWKFENWHLYHYRMIRAVKPSITRFDWVRVL